MRALGRAGALGLLLLAGCAGRPPDERAEAGAVDGRTSGQGPQDRSGAAATEAARARAGARESAEVGAPGRGFAEAGASGQGPRDSSAAASGGAGGASGQVARDSSAADVKGAAGQGPRDSAAGGVNGAAGHVPRDSAAAGGVKGAAGQGPRDSAAGGVTGAAGQGPRDGANGDPGPTSGAPLPSPRAMPAGYLAVARACEARESIVVAAVGDLLIHHELQIQATKAPERFRVLWAGVEDLLRAADVTYANLEVPLAAGVLKSGEEVADPGLVFDRKVYTTYPRFNVHPSMAEDLVTSGVDVVSTANNHALDRGALGADKTLAALDAAGLKHTGTRARGDSGPWHAVTTSKGFSVAWLACTMHTNMIEDDAGQVLRCFDEPERVADEVRALAKTKGLDAVIVTPHWGKEYTPTPTKQQQEFARKWAEAGAAAIVGNHPHVLQPWELVTTKDGREVLVAYSLGNFVSHQPDLAKRSTAILMFGLGRARAGAPAFVTGIGYVPVHVRQTGEEFFAEAIDRVGGPADCRAHVVKMFGAANLLAPDRPLEVAPQCRPAP